MRRPDPIRWLPILVLAAAGLPVFCQSTSASAGTPLPAANASTQPIVQPAPSPDPTPEQIGDAYAARQRYQAAIAAYSKDLHPTAAIWNKMGVAYQMMFNLRGATRSYQESLRLNSKNAMAYNNMGTIYDSLKEYSKATKMYRKALKIDPNAPLILKNLGTNLLVQHKNSKGLEAYEEAMRLDPTVFEKHDSPTVANPTPIRERGELNYFMARGCVRMGQTACALEYLRMAIDEGYTTIKKVTEDADFVSLRDSPAFRQLVAEQQPPRQHP